MSGFLNLCSLGCEPVWGDSNQTWFDCVMVILDFYPIYVNIGSYVVATVTCSLFFWILSIGLTIDIYLNWILTNIFRQRSPLPAYASHGFQMPAYASQLLTYSIVILAFYTLVYRMEVSTYRIFLIVASQVAILFARLYLNVNTNGQIIVGVLFGILDASIQSYVIRVYVYPNADWICAMAISRYMGIKNTYMINLRQTEMEASDRTMSKLLDAVDMSSPEELVMFAREWREMHSETPDKLRLPDDVIL